MSIIRRFDDLASPAVQNLLEERDRRQIEQFARSVDQEIDQRMRAFEAALQERITALAERDLVGDFERAVAEDRAAVNEQLAQARAKLAEANRIAGEINNLDVGDKTKDAIERLQTSLTGLHNDLNNAEEKVGSFARGLGRTAGAAVRGAFLGIL